MQTCLIFYPCRGSSTQCDESTSAWINMTGFQSRVIGEDIGDKLNPIQMDVNHTVRLKPLFVEPFILCYILLRGTYNLFNIKV